MPVEPDLHAASPDMAQATQPDLLCVPDCTGRSCGTDPLCGMSCGVCTAMTLCSQTSMSAECTPPTITWEVDGTIIHQDASFDAYYETSEGGAVLLYFPHWGESVTIAPGLLADIPTDIPLSCFSTPQINLRLTTIDDGYAGLMNLPAVWQNLDFGSCGTASGDVVQVATATFTTLSSTHYVGSYEFLIQGMGPRAGSTLHVYGSFDVVPISL